jgi:hypothetical protein
MKYLVFTILFIDVLLIAGAIQRVRTADETTEPLFVVSGLMTAMSSNDDEAGFGETGTGGAVVEHLGTKRLDEINEIGSISTVEGRPGGGANSSGTGARDRARRNLSGDSSE